MSDKLYDEKRNFIRVGVGVKAPLTSRVNMEYVVI